MRKNDFSRLACAAILALAGIVVKEFGRTLRGLQLTHNTSHLALREHVTGAGAG